MSASKSLNQQSQCYCKQNISQYCITICENEWMGALKRSRWCWPVMFQPNYDVSALVVLFAVGGKLACWLKRCTASYRPVTAYGNPVSVAMVTLLHGGSKWRVPSTYLGLSENALIAHLRASSGNGDCSEDNKSRRADEINKSPQTHLIWIGEGELCWSSGFGLMWTRRSV